MSLTVAERHQIRTREQGGEAVEELVKATNDSHKEFVAAGARTRESIMHAANAARRTGIQLASLKEKVGHGRFLKLFATSHGKPNVAPALHFDASTGARFMAIARNLPEEITELPEAVKSLSDLMVAIGAKAEPCRAAQNSRSLFGPFTRAEEYAGDAWSIVQKEIEKAEPEAWPEEVRSHFAQVIKPYYELYPRLIGSAQEQS